MTDKPVSYYDILKITPQSSDQDIQRAYRSLALKYHPDRNPQNRRLAALRFKIITEAYAALKTKERRRIYDIMQAEQNKLSAGNDNTAPKRAGWFSRILGGLAANENEDEHR